MTPSPGTTPSGQVDLFQVPKAGQSEVVLYLKRLPTPRDMKAEKPKDPKPNFHIPSFKNSKRWITKLPSGKPLKRPFLITSPEFQQWREKATQSLISQLLSMSQTGSGETPPERSKLFAICSLLPEDDSCNFLIQGSWKVERVNPGEEGAKIVIRKLR